MDSRPLSGFRVIDVFIPHQLPPILISYWVLVKWSLVACLVSLADQMTYFTFNFNELKNENQINVWQRIKSFLDSVLRSLMPSQFKQFPHNRNIQNLFLRFLLITNWNTISNWIEAHVFECFCDFNS